MQLINLSTDVYLYKKQERFELMSCQSQVKYLTTYESLILYLRLLLYFSLFNLHFTFFPSYLISLYLPCSLSLYNPPLSIQSLYIFVHLFFLCMGLWRQQQHHHHHPFKCQRFSGSDLLLFQRTGKSQVLDSKSIVSSRYWHLGR